MGTVQGYRTTDSKGPFGTRLPHDDQGENRTPVHPPLQILPQGPRREAPEVGCRCGREGRKGCACACQVGGCGVLSMNIFCRYLWSIEALHGGCLAIDYTGVQAASN